jgi:flagellar motor switch protein FliN/FliY
MTDDFTSGLPGVPGSTTASAAPLEAIEAAIRAAAAAGPLLPSPDPLVPGEPVASAATLPLAGGGAVLAKLGHGVAGEICMLVGAELVDALAESPLGALDLVPAVQSALDAAAAALGGRAEAGMAVEPAVALDEGAADIQVVVPLMADGFAHAALIVRARKDVTGPAIPAASPGGAAGGGDSGDGAAASAGAGDTAGAGGSGAGGSGASTASGVTAALAAGGKRQPARRSGLDLLHDVAMEVTVELGRTRMTVRDLLGLSPGSLIELDRAAGSPADLLVHGTLLARGEIVVIDEEFGLRITEIVTDESAGT